ncbi:MAG: protein phosphatase 2C domain-containing protein [Gammaproteobacteria bacterium]|nr:protein phosphatase 2C domain-containing protein [Gammaproteobacteria bacterium]
MNNQIQWLSYADTNTGKVRKINQDAYSSIPDKQIWAVADGMGGHKSGELASKAIINALNSIETSKDIGVIVKRVHHELDKVNQLLIEMAYDSSNDEIIGSTAVIFIARDRHCAYLWSGDSRLYLFRNDHLEQISHDHTNINMLLENGTSLEEAMSYPYAQSLTHAVGAEAKLYLDVQMQEVKYNDIFLLCSDGLNKEVSNTEIENMINTISIEQLVPKLIELTLQRGARDNVTVVLAKAIRAEPSAGKEPSADKEPSVEKKPSAGKNN